MSNEKLSEHISDIQSAGNVVSHCCGSTVYAGDLCVSCHEHCSSIYDDIECGGAIDADTNHCLDCETKYNVES